MIISVQVKTIIEKAIPGAKVYLYDPDGQHLQATVVSEAFEGCSLLERSRKIMNALKTNFSTNLHALQLKTYTPGEWERKGKKNE